MKLDPTPLSLPGCYTLHLDVIHDVRGSFRKLFHQRAFEPWLRGFVPREIYMTTSNAGVLRGMHFQLPPHDHGKIVICLRGKVSDVLLDLRTGPYHGHVASIELRPRGPNAVIIPKGIAHGFYAHHDDSTLMYLVETIHAPTHDRGIAWNSFGYEWPDRDPILSDRDREHPAFSDFVPPAQWQNP